ncbi:MAG: PEP-CTERM sorting domain-containing protein [Candidatus Omnitrophota bacterium]
MKRILLISVGMLVLFSPKAQALISLDNLTFRAGETDTLDLSFDALGEGELWFQVKADPNDLGSRLSLYLGEFNFEETTQLNLNWWSREMLNEGTQVLPFTVGNTITHLEPHGYHRWPLEYYFGITNIHDDFNPNWDEALIDRLSSIRPTGLPPEEGLPNKPKLPIAPNSPIVPNAPNSPNAPNLPKSPVSPNVPKSPNPPNLGALFSITVPTSPDSPFAPDSPASIVFAQERDVQTTTNPEPATLALFGSGIAGLFFRRKRVPFRK